MKKKIWFYLYLMVSFQIVYSQDTRYIQQPAVGIHVLLNVFSYKDSLHAPGQFNYRRAGIALNYLQGITPRTDWNINVAGSFVNFPGIEKSGTDKRLLLEGDVSLREKLFPGRRKVNPFLQAGVGVSRFDDYYGIYVPAGLGLHINLPGEALLLLNAQYRIPVTSNQTAHFYGSIGIAGIIGRRKILSKKNVPITNRRRDLSSKDTDGDGIIDSLDACPLTAGLQAFRGCPDTDGDGIPDKDDKCPTVAGISRLQGCPIPDRDKDGVNDEADKCPDLPGDKEHGGCPLIQKNILEKIELAAKNVFFETDSYQLLPSSDKALDEVARLLKRHPFLKLDIEGHTDNTGLPENNKLLSQRRANSVLEYLSLRAGIAPEKLTAAGYGSSRPIADNNTAEGRMLNRRVEFKLKY